MRRRLVPNHSARELRREFLDSEPAERLRQAIELSHVGAVLARAGGFGRDVDPTVRLDDVLRELCEAEVGFVLAGDLAVAVHGYERAGRDQDLIDVTALRMAHGLEE